LSEDEKKAEMEKMSADFEAWLHSGTNVSLSHGDEGER
jgi:hypothetical protein